MTDIISSLLSQLNKLYELASNIKHADLQFQISELKSLAADAKSENAGLKHQILELNARIQQLREELEKPLEFRYGLYFEPGKPEPYCTHCWEADHKQIHLKFDSNPNTETVWCPHCKVSYPKPPA